MVYDNNNTVINVPEYLTKNYFEKVLRNGLNLNNDDNIVIINIKFSIGSPGGEHYCSEIYRVMIEYKINNNDTIKKVSLIIKYMANLVGHAEVLEKMGFYEKEVVMFTKIMPSIEKLLNYSGMFAPKCFYTNKEPVRTIVMQDLTALGYKLADRLEGLDEEHSKVLLRKLGQYHAASMLLIKNHPELTKPFDKGFIQEVYVGTPLFNTIFEKSLEHITEIVSEWPDYENLAQKLKNLQKNFANRAIKCLTRKENDIRVLNHGDLWVNNFMFKYDNGKPCDVIFIDLQISYYGGLGVDINYFLNTSVQLDLLKAKRYELIRYYYKSLKTTLEELQYQPIPTWEDVKNDIRDKEFFGFVALEAILPIISMNREDSQNSSFESLSDEKREIMFSSKRLIETMKYSLDRFDELGVFD